MRKNQFEFLAPNYVRMEYLVSKKQFFIYEFDTMLNIVQKVKIPKHIFQDYVKKFNRWEFEALRPFRLGCEDIAYFTKHCNFYPLDPEKNCIDVFIDIQDYSLIDIPYRKITKISREFFKQSCKKIYKEYPDTLDSHSLKILAQILDRPMPQNAFFTEKILHLSIMQNENIFSFRLKKTNLYDNLFSKQFEHFFKIGFRETMLFLQENDIDFKLSKEAESEVGYSIADTARNIQVVLQYDKHFEICIPDKKQKVVLEHFFYKPLPNMNFFLGVYALGGGKYIAPNLYFNIYDQIKSNDYRRLKFDLNLFSNKTLKKIFSAYNGGYVFDFYSQISSRDKRRIFQKLNLDLKDNECYLELVY